MLQYPRQKATSQGIISELSIVLLVTNASFFQLAVLLLFETINFTMYEFYYRLLFEKSFV